MELEPSQQCTAKGQEAITARSNKGILIGYSKQYLHQRVVQHRDGYPEKPFPWRFSKCNCRRPPATGSSLDDLLCPEQGAGSKTSTSFYQSTFCYDLYPYFQYYFTLSWLSNVKSWFQCEFQFHGKCWHLQLLFIVVSIKQKKIIKNFKNNCFEVKEN